MSLSSSTIVQVALLAVVDKNYKGKRNNDHAAIARLAMPLHKRIQRSIKNAQQAALEFPVDWEKQVLAPIIGETHITEDLGVSVADAEYVVLLAAVIILAYEILVLPAAVDDLSTNKYLVRLFDNYLGEPVVSCQLIARLTVEQRRLERAGAETDVRRAMRKLLALVPDTTARTSAWNVETSVAEYQASSISVCANPELPDPARTSLSTFTTYPRDLRVEVYLKPGCSWQFDFVESIVESDGVLIVQTCVGLRMQVEPGFVVSEISGVFDTVTVEVPPECKTAFAATIIVPPGYSFHATEVEHVSELAGDLAQTMIETTQAVLNVSNGNYTVKRRNCHRSVHVQSTEC